MSRTGPSRLLRTSLLLLLVSFCLYWFSDTVADPDIWGHVRFGQDILRAGSIPRTDIYSYRTAGQKWINHEWLSEVIISSIYNWSGSRGLIISKLFISLLIMGVGLVHLLRRGMGPVLAVLLLILVSVPFRMGMGTIRPQMFTILLFFLELLVLESAVPGREYRLWVLPPLMAAWVNLHGGVLAGIATLGLGITARIVAHIRRRTEPANQSSGALLHLLLLGVVCALTLLLNPYGAELPRFLIRTATVPRPEITEWMPLGLLSFPGLLFLGLLAMGMLSLSATTIRPRFEAVLIISATAVQPLISSRHYPLFALALVVLGGKHMADVWNRSAHRALYREHYRRGVAVVALAVSPWLLVQTPARLNCIRIEPFYFPFPARVVGLLKQADAEGNMAVPFDWGEFVLWHLGPRIKVSIDGRRETVYSDESYQQSRDLERGTGMWDALLKTGPATDLVLAPLGSPTINLLSMRAGWVPLYGDSFGVLFVRSTYPGLQKIVSSSVPQLPDNGRGLCFADPGRWNSARGEFP